METSEPGATRAIDIPTGRNTTLPIGRHRSISTTSPLSTDPGLNAARVVLGGHPTAVPPAVTGYVRRSLYDATHHVFLGLVVLSLLAAGALLLIPRRTSQI